MPFDILLQFICKFIIIELFFQLLSSFRCVVFTVEVQEVPEKEVEPDPDLD